MSSLNINFQREENQTPFSFILSDTRVLSSFLSHARFEAAVQFPAYITEGNREMVKLMKAKSGRLMESVFCESCSSSRQLASGQFILPQLYKPGMKGWIDAQGYLQRSTVSVWECSDAAVWEETGLGCAVFLCPTSTASSSYSNC